MNFFNLAFLSCSFSIKSNLIIPSSYLIGTNSQFNFQLGNYISLQNGQGYLLATSTNITKTFIFELQLISLQGKQQKPQKKYYAYLIKIKDKETTSIGFQAFLINGYFLIDQNKILPNYFQYSASSFMPFFIPVLQSKVYQLTVYISKEAGVAFFKMIDTFNFTTRVPTFFTTKNDISALPKNIKSKQNDDYYYGLFYQIIEFKGKKVLWLAVYCKYKNQSSFTKPGWVGVLYGSKSITDNDCTLIQYKLSKANAFLSANVQDSRIFGGGWPYADTNKLMNATDDVVYTYSATSQYNFGISYKIQRTKMNQHLQAFLVSYYRQFDTQDTEGDEIIKQKSNYKVCIALNMQTKSKQELVQCFYINTVYMMMALYFLQTVLFLM